jgi:hypothetical protein
VNALFVFRCEYKCFNDARGVVQPDWHRVFVLQSLPTRDTFNAAQTCLAPLLKPQMPPATGLTKAQTTALRKRVSLIPRDTYVSVGQSGTAFVRVDSSLAGPLRAASRKGRFPLLLAAAAERSPQLPMETGLDYARRLCGQISRGSRSYLTQLALDARALPHQPLLTEVTLLCEADRLRKRERVEAATRAVKSYSKIAMFPLLLVASSVLAASQLFSHKQVGAKRHC